FIGLISNNTDSTGESFRISGHAQAQITFDPRQCGLFRSVRLFRQRPAIRTHAPIDIHLQRQLVSSG
ncbi:MAG: hypothetical protein LPK06_12285, partial [Marinobacter sp.]|nr:hypothetical protein [Marinobacter sp.]